MAILYALLHILSVLTLQRLEHLNPSHMYLFFFTKNEILTNVFKLHGPSWQLITKAPNSGLKQKHPKTKHCRVLRRLKSEYVKYRPTVPFERMEMRACATRMAQVLDCLLNVPECSDRICFWRSQLRCEYAIFHGFNKRVDRYREWGRWSMKLVKLKPLND